VIDLDAMRKAERARDRSLAHKRLIQFIAEWSPENRAAAARFSAELFQIAQTMQREQYELLRPVLENFLNMHAGNRTIVIPAPKEADRK
jgi:5-formyltetrahydrofolate cyclo-ligase